MRVAALSERIVEKANTQTLLCALRRVASEFPERKHLDIAVRIAAHSELSKGKHTILQILLGM